MIITRLSGATPRQLEAVSAGSFLYAALRYVEGLTLMWRQRWAAYVTVIATAALIPLEVFELTRRVSWLKVVVIAMNVAVVWYLVARRLDPTEERAILTRLRLGTGWERTPWHATQRAAWGGVEEKRGEQRMKQSSSWRQGIVSVRVKLASIFSPSALVLSIGPRLFHLFTLGRLLAEILRVIPTAAECERTPRHAVQSAAWEALRRANADG
jgi:hypothetical protein